MHLQIFCIGGYHTTSYVSMTRKSVTVYTIYIRKKNCGPFCYETPDSFGSEFLNITYPHPPRLSTVKGAPVGLNDFFSQETHGRSNSSRLGFHRIVRSSEFPPKILGGNHQTSQLAAVQGKPAVGFLQKKNGGPGLCPV